MTRQTLDQKRGEIKFRQKISEQHTGRNAYFPDEYTDLEMLAELKKRIGYAQRDFAPLSTQGVLKSPYLEIGAEYCIRSLVLENIFHLKGYALDIAHAPLAQAPFFAGKLKLPQLPQRICADAEKLPFPTNSLPFVFCYQTLHHFPDPSHLLTEVYRVLTPGGYFLFAEEPVKQNFNFNLFRRPTKMSGLMKLLRTSLVLPFISQIGKTETDHGIFEGTFTLATWEKLMTRFPKVVITINSIILQRNESFTKKGSGLFLSPTLPLKILLFLVGGGISGLIQKPGNETGFHDNRLFFVCPDCKRRLVKTDHGFYCQSCRIKYPIKEKIIQLLPLPLSQLLNTKL